MFVYCFLFVTWRVCALSCSDGGGGSHPSQGALSGVVPCLRPALMMLILITPHPCPQQGVVHLSTGQLLSLFVFYSFFAADKQFVGRCINTTQTFLTSKLSLELVSSDDSCLMWSWPVWLSVSFAPLYLPVGPQHPTVNRASLCPLVHSSVCVSPSYGYGLICSYV